LSRVRLHVRGRGLPDGEPVEWWIVDGTLSAEPVADAETVFGTDGYGGWIVPGLVDAHCHVGLGAHGAVDLDEAIVQAETERDVGALLLRDAGSPTDTRSLDDHDDLPRIIRHGRHLARLKRYQRGLAIELEDESQLPDAVAEQARWGDGWVKLVGDWIDRDIGDLAPLWSDEILKQAIDAAHDNGARVTAHVFSEDALPGLINAGIDCIEHGTGLTDDTIELMVEHGTALVPTLINIENFPGIADGAAKYTTYARHIRDLYEQCYPRIAAAREAGIPIYAGTDAGSMVAHGRIADEIEALKGIGMSPTEALGAASWDARKWLGRPGLEHGASADLVCYAADPRSGVGALNHPDMVILRGRVF
jgi:imidazolonepropionase-like amidohydrolase